MIPDLVTPARQHDGAFGWPVPLMAARDGDQCEVIGETE